jgi:hypothetical protein
MRALACSARENTGSALVRSLGNAERGFVNRLAASNKVGRQSTTETQNRRGVAKERNVTIQV